MEKIKKTFFSDPQLLPEIEDWIISILKKAKLSDDQLNIISMAVSEAASNSIIHGNQAKPDKKIEITISIMKNQLKVFIKDEGKGFKIEKVPDPTEPENMMKDNGRGIHIMKAVLDNLEYKFGEDGTETILTIKI